MGRDQPARALNRRIRGELTLNVCSGRNSGAVRRTKKMLKTTTPTMVKTKANSHVQSGRRHHFLVRICFVLLMDCWVDGMVRLRPGKRSGELSTLLSFIHLQLVVKRARNEWIDAAISRRAAQTGVDCLLRCVQRSFGLYRAVICLKPCRRVHVRPRQREAKYSDNRLSTPKFHARAAFYFFAFLIMLPISSPAAAPAVAGETAESRTPCL